MGKSVSEGKLEIPELFWIPGQAGFEWKIKYSRIVLDPHAYRFLMEIWKFPDFFGSMGRSVFETQGRHHEIFYRTEYFYPGYCSSEGQCSAKKTRSWQCLWQRRRKAKWIGKEHRTRNSKHIMNYNICKPRNAYQVLFQKGESFNNDHVIMKLNYIINFSLLCHTLQDCIPNGPEGL